MRRRSEKNAVRPALAVSIGSSRRRFVDSAAHEMFRLEVDEFSVNLGFLLRTAGVWDCLPRAQKVRIKRLPLLVLTAAGRISIEGDRHRRR
ncbi:hypothetical protein GOD83_28240 [Sinorhizobium medicae]|nr:hypothetical protein [Sinorhizobium medicae]MDX0580498.1 hypothetical protein [Sinorhizobium medicae]MDX0784128.1 hypothetical protein [Sinorhizobium medicae]